MMLPEGNWTNAPGADGVEPYARFIAGRLSADLAAGRLRGGDGVVVSLRLEDAGAVAAVLAAPLVLSKAERDDLAAGPGGWPVAVSGAVRLVDLAGVVAAAEATAGLVLVDVSQVLPGDCLQGNVVSAGSKARASGSVPGVVAIIDDGIALGHGNFRAPNGGTRIVSAWIMDAASNGMHEHGYGRVLSRNEIDGYIAGATVPGGFDDGRFLSLSGLVDHSRDIEETVARAFGHGTAVLDLFAGVPPGAPRDAAGSAPIVAVQFPSAQARDTSGAGLRPFIRDALIFVLARAAELAGKGPPPPVVINLSYGLVAGPHDGTHQIERDIAELLGPHDHVHLVLPAGNSALTQCHGRFNLAPGEVAVADWLILPDDRTPSFAEIWPRGGTGEGLAVRLETPDGDLSDWVEPGNDRAVLGADLAEVSMTAYASVGQRRGFLAALSPSFDLTAPGRVVAHGRWRIHLRNDGPGSQETDIWVQRDVGPFTGNLRGRQPILDSVDYLRFDELTDVRDRDQQPPVEITREGTINAMATGTHPRTHVIGAWMGGTGGRPAPYTSRTLEGGTKPALAGLGETSRVHRGVLAAGTMSPAVAGAGGTSMATAHVSRSLFQALVDGLGPLVADQPPGQSEILPGVLADDGDDRVGAGVLFPRVQNYPDRLVE